MNVFIVYAHPEPSSFTAALKGRAVEALGKAGHAVTVSDLYGEGFNPVAGRHDFTTVADPARFHYQTEQLYASKHNGFVPELAREQARLLAADLLVFVFPLWWGGVPAILKGWFERVGAYGVAYADGMRYDKGYFLGRRAVMGLCTGGTPQRFSREGVYGEIRDVLYPTQRLMLEYLGLEVLEPFVAYAAPRVDAAAREDYLDAWEARLIAIAGDTAWQARLERIKAGETAGRNAGAEPAWASQR